MTTHIEIKVLDNGLNICKGEEPRWEDFGPIPDSQAKS